MFYSNENFYVLDSNFEFSKEELLSLRKEVIERCSEIIHHDYESYKGPDTRDTLRIRNFIHFSVSKNNSKRDEKISRYIYEEYKFPYLVNLIDRILKRDFSAIDELIHINVSKENKPLIDKINIVNSELDSISNFNISEKRSKLDELENLLVQVEYNKRQVSVFPYYEKVLDLLGIRKVSVEEEKRNFSIPKLVITA